MIKEESKKVYYTSEIVTEVYCDICGKDLRKEFFVEVNVQGKCFVEGQKFLESSGLNGIKKEICNDCLSPMLKLIKIPTNTVF